MEGDPEAAPVQGQPLRGLTKALLVGLVIVAVALGGVWLLRTLSKVSLTTEYQAVLLTNGQVFFGRLEDAGSAFPVLTDVYWVRSEVNQQTKQVANTLVRRGGEWHAPDRMVLNRQHILVIEPVKPDSKTCEGIL